MLRAAPTPGVSDGQVPVDLRRFPWVRRLAIDYAYDFASVASFFAGNPADRSTWSEAIARTQAHPRDRVDIAEVIAGQQARRQAPPASVAAARQLADDRTVAVLTGQQAGLFGGPLYTLFKALTAIQLAERVTREHGVPAVAVFWVEAEDHDWDEVRSCTVFDTTGRAKSLGLPARSATESSPVASVALPASIGEVITELGRTLPATEFSPALLDALRAAYRPGRPMSEAFAVWLERLLGPLGLVVYDASDPASKALASRVFVHELSTPGRTAALAAQAGADLVERGYHAQVRVQEDSLALFHLEGGRRSIKHVNGHFVVGDQEVGRESLAHQAHTQPGQFSPNVLLRPIVQDTLFPTVCYVAGPSELAYLGQLRGVYQHFGVPMPLLYPRATATLVDSAALRFLNRSGMAVEALQAQDDSALNAWLRDQIPPAVEDAFAGACRHVDSTMAALIEALPSLDPTLEGAARSTLGRMQHDLASLRNKMIQAAKRRDETLRRQFERTRALTFPDGHPQERAIGFVSFLNQYGPALVDRLAERLPLDMGRHWLVTI